MIRLLLLYTLILIVPSTACRNDQKVPGEQKHILLFSKTDGFRHESIPAGVNALTSLFNQKGFAVVYSENAELFTEDELSKYDGFVFFQTTGDILTEEQQSAFEKILLQGKGFTGIHSAADTEPNWSFYGKLVGARFHDHPPIQTHTVLNVNPGHFINSEIPLEWKRTDECYNFKTLPIDVDVLLVLDETTYSGGKHGNYHPISWCQEWQGIKSFYTAMGHSIEHYQDSMFLKHILQGVDWTLKRP